MVQRGLERLAVWAPQHADRLALACIAAPFAIGWALVSPWQDVPVIDDWAYAWSVEHLLKTGHLLMSDRSSIYPVVQILWGALFARLGGFSFGVLRLSTVILAVFGCWAMYRMLRELACSTKVSLLAALTVALYPAYFALAFTFMTDVPFVSLSAISLFFYVSGVRRDRPGLLWWGSVFAVLAFLIRQVGVVLPLCAWAAADRRVASWSAVRRFWLPIAAGMLAVCALWVALPRVLGPLPVIEQRQADLQWSTRQPLAAYARWNAELLWIVAFPFTPLLLCPVTRWRRALAIAGLSMVLLAGLRLTLGSIPTPLPNEQTWALQDLAMRINLIGGDLHPSAWTVRVTPVLKVLGAIIVASLIAGLPSLREAPWRAGRVLVAAGLLHVVLINMIWAYYDRYYLVLVPTVVYLAAAPLLDRRVHTWPAGVVLALWASIGMTGTRTMLATNALCAEIARDLEAQGVRPSEIDAGYALNGWRLYSHPENLPPNADRGHDVPFVTSDVPTAYGIVTTPKPGEDILRMEILPSAWWQLKGRLYLVHRH
jgi:hypothetical protein